MILLLAGWLSLLPSPPAPPQLCPKAQLPQSRPTTQFVRGLDGEVFRRRPDLEAPPLASPADLDLLRRFVDALRGRGTELVLAPLPPRGMVHAVDPSEPLSAHFDPAAQRAQWQAWIDQLRSTGARVADLGAADVNGRFYFRTDNHWTPAGAQAAARLVAAQLPHLRRPGQTEPPQPVGTFQSPNQLGQTLAKLCNTAAAPAEQAPLFRPAPLPIGLLDEVPPSVVLVGTSNSNLGGQDNANFSGWLQAELGLPVLNYAIIGGGLEASMLSALESADLWQRPPPALVWETAANTAYAEPDTLRQLLAALEPACTPERAVWMADGLADGEPILRLPPEADLHGAGWFVHIQTRPSLLHFEVRLEDSSGVTESIEIRRINRVAQKGQHRLLLSPDGTTPLRSVAVRSAQEGAASPVTVRLCATASPGAPATSAALPNQP